MAVMRPWMAQAKTVILEIATSFRVVDLPVAADGRFSCGSLTGLEAWMKIDYETCRAPTCELTRCADSY